ncbi:MAG TPA: PQQ-binding-like beta-propeller repeat protein [Gemmataceae bacterium]|nr:PQQ-binding-like beta-propeller repeat protein [Gemmataceae bacterium]
MAGRSAISGVALLLFTAAIGAEQWPGWRGPRGDGTSQELHVPTRWTSTDNVRWKVPIPGKGHSSPIVWDDRIFLTTCLENEEKRLLLCLNRSDGRLLWQREVLKAKLERKHNLNSFASATPATDGKHVWVAFLQGANMQVACYDFDGNKVWQRSPGEFHSIQGFCSSPVLYKDLVILNGDQDAEAWIVALDKATGTERWRADRPNRTRSYCTPLLIDAAGKKQLVLTGSKCVASYDPDTGKQIWIVNGPTEQFVSSMVFTENVLFLTAGYPTHHLMGIRPDGQGDVTRTHILWHDRQAADYVPSPIAHGKYFFFVNDNGTAGCVAAKTGERMWTQRLGKHHSASPVSAGDLLYFLDDDGNTFVVKPEPRFELVSRNPLGEECYASPAISHEEILIRGLNHLYCIGQPGKAAQGE